MSDLIKQAASMLQRGRVISFPTETVYALACNAYDGAAIARIYQIKGREFNKPLALLVKDIASLDGVVKMHDEALKLAQAFCPGPITFVLPKASGCAIINGTNQQLYTIAVRIPDHAIALQILQDVDCPIFATSANLSGMEEAIDAEQVRKYFPDLDMIIDGGKCQIGKASTIVDFCGKSPVILREGSVTKEQIEAVLRK
jgi:L-threonylcarbamoyladenylate synthase